MRSASLKLNLIYATIGAGFFNAGRFVAVIMIGKFGVPEVLGQFNWCLLTVAPVVTFFMFGMRSVLIADTGSRRTFGSYRMARLVCLALAAGVLAAIAACKSPGAVQSGFLLIFLGVAASKLVEAVGEIYWGLFQKDERIDLLALSSGLRGLLMSAAFLVAPPLVWYAVEVLEWLPRSHLSWGAAGALGLYSVGCALLVWRVDHAGGQGMTHFDGARDWREVGGIIASAFPLGLVSLLMTLTAAVPAWTIEATQGARGFRFLGFFSALYYLFFAGNLLVNQLGQVAANRLSRLYVDNLTALVGLIVKLELMCLALGLAMIALAYQWGGALLSLFYRPEYSAYHDALMIVVTAQSVTLLGSMLGFAVTQMRLYWLQVVAWIVMLGAGTAVAIRFIPDRPVHGGAYAMLAVSLAQLVMYSAAVIYGIWVRRTAIAGQTTTDSGQGG